MGAIAPAVCAEYSPRRVSGCPDILRSFGFRAGAKLRDDPMDSPKSVPLRSRSLRSYLPGLSPEPRPCVLVHVRIPVETRPKRGTKGSRAGELRISAARLGLSLWRLEHAGLVAF